MRDQNGILYRKNWLESNRKTDKTNNTFRRLILPKIQEELQSDYVGDVDENQRNANNWRTHMKINATATFAYTWQLVTDV